MRADSIKYRLVFPLHVKRTDITGYVNAAVRLILPFERMVAQRRMYRIVSEQFNSFLYFSA